MAVKPIRLDPSELSHSSVSVVLVQPYGGGKPMIGHDHGKMLVAMTEDEAIELCRRTIKVVKQLRKG